MALVGASAWGRGAGFHILFQIMMYSGASIGSGGRTEPSERQLCPEAVCALVLGVPLIEGGCLPRWKLNSARRGQLLTSRRAWVSPISGQFRGCVRTGWGRGREGQWAHFPGLVPGVGWGVLGITPGDIFTVPAPFWQGQIPGVRVAALRVCFRWKDRVSAALAGQEMIAFSSVL